MKRSRFSEEQIIAILRESEGAEGVGESLDDLPNMKTVTPPSQRDWPDGEELESKKEEKERQSQAAFRPIAQLRKKLLDASNRNRLLNFKHTARGSSFVRVINRSLVGAFDYVQKRKAFRLRLP